MMTITPSLASKKIEDKRLVKQRYTLNDFSITDNIMFETNKCTVQSINCYCNEVMRNVCILLYIDIWLINSPWIFEGIAGGYGTV